jgi:hypothetical protein
MMTAALVAFASGCARTMLPESAADKYPGDDAELQFWQQLETQTVVTNNDALHGLTLLADGQDPAQDYEQRVAAARTRGWLGSSDAPPANESATMGRIAVAICEILDIKGGVTMHVFGPIPRYCTRELVFLRYIPPRSEFQAISGLEFIDLITRAEEQMPRSELPLPLPDEGQQPAAPDDIEGLDEPPLPAPDSVASAG